LFLAEVSDPDDVLSAIYAAYGGTRAQIIPPDLRSAAPRIGCECLARRRDPNCRGGDLGEEVKEVLRRGDGELNLLEASL
jgi:hypothetical protein